MKFTDEQIAQMADGYPPPDYDCEQAITAMSKEIAELHERLKGAEEIIEIAGCLTHMKVVDAVDYNANHNHFRISEDFKTVVIDDPIAKVYSLLEEQMIPVFKLLKEKVEKYRKEGGNDAQH